MTNAEARFNKSLRPRKPEGSLGRTAQDVHLDSHTAPELCMLEREYKRSISRGGRPGLPVTNSPYGLCGRQATFEDKEEERRGTRAKELRERRGGCLG